MKYIKRHILVESLLQVFFFFKLYLSYLEQWVSITQFGKLQKNILEEEWKFITQTAPHFPGGEAMSSKVFWYLCLFIDSLLLLSIICSH